MYQFEKIAIDNLDEAQFNNFPDKSVYTTIPWLNFIIEDNPGAELIIIAIRKCEELIGYFSGALIKKFGIKIIGSPFKGWSTCYMGLDVYDNSQRAAIYNDLIDFLFKQYKCLYVEIEDRNLKPDDLGKKFQVRSIKSLDLNIDRTNEQLIKSFKNDCKYSIRQFEKRGATLEVAEPDNVFAEEYYDQLQDVFAKQNLVPTYSLNKVTCILKNLKNSNELLCLRVRSPEGKSIATSIFLGFNNICFFWGGASYREGQHYRPNEYMIWYAIQYWRGKGISTLDMMGVRPYKLKFSPQEIEYPLICAAKYKVLINLRNFAEKSYYAMGHWRGWIKSKKSLLKIRS